MSQEFKPIIKADQLPLYERVGRNKCNNLLDTFR